MHRLLGHRMGQTAFTADLRIFQFHLPPCVRATKINIHHHIPNLCSLISPFCRLPINCAAAKESQTYRHFAQSPNGTTRSLSRGMNPPPRTAVVPFKYLDPIIKGGIQFIWHPLPHSHLTASTALAFLRLTRGSSSAPLQL